MIIAVKDVVQSLTKAIKAIHMYGLNHPSSKNLYVPLYEKINKLLKNLPEIHLRIEQFSIIFEEETLYTEQESDLTIAFKLFRDGIRSLIFFDGLSLDELSRFLEIVSKSSREQDIALDLWESHFSHIDFYVVEEDDEIVDYRIPDTPKAPVDFDKQLQRIIEKEKIDVGARIAIQLEGNELKTLTQEIHDTTRMSFVPVTITTLLNFLKTDQSQEIIDSLLELLERCIDNRDFTNARRIVHRLTQNPDIDPLAKIANEATIIGFKDIVNTAPDNVYHEFIAFIGMFSKDAILCFLKLLAQVKRKERLGELRNRIVYIMQDDPSPIIPYLSSKDDAICINAIALVGQIKLKNIGQYLKPLMSHESKDVRIEVIAALQNNESGSMVAKFLDDEQPLVRIKALQAIAAIKYLRIYEDLLKRIRNKYFRLLDFSEQKEYFNALVATGGSDVLKQLRKMLFKWFLFGGKKYMVMRKLAAYALASVPTEKARKILDDGMKKHNKDIRNACEMALRQL
jgi:HEAT repeat protein